MEWKLTGVPHSYRVTLAALFYNVEDLGAARAISTYNIITSMPGMSQYGRRLFSNNILVSLIGNIYKVMLNNLKYNDTGSYFLVAHIGRSLASAPEIRQSVIKILLVNGKFRFGISQM